MKSRNTIWHHASVTKERREKLNGHKCALVWLTGLSGSGKSTLSHAVEEELYQRGCHTCVLDGDNVRHGLCSDLGFKETDRRENIRRVGEAAKLLMEAGLITLTAFISPFIEDRKRVRSMFPHGNFLEVFCDCALDVCEQRDVKGIYKRARMGEIKNFTGINSPYEPPIMPELIIQTDKQTLRESVELVIAMLENRGIVKSSKNPASAIE